jgi:hypothetical protein
LLQNFTGARRTTLSRDSGQQISPWSDLPSPHHFLNPITSNGSAPGAVCLFLGLACGFNDRKNREGRFSEVLKPSSVRGHCVCPEVSAGIDDSITCS